MIPNIKAVIFDVDGTLSDQISWLNVTSGLGADPLEHKRIFDDMRAGRLDYPKAKSLLIALWQETGNSNKSFMTQMFNSWEVKHDAANVISYLMNKYHVCLMSGAVDLYVQSIAQRLGVKDWYANTRLIWDENDNLVDFDYNVNQAKKKAEQFLGFCILNNYSPEDCIAVGDGDSDIELFKQIKGIAVNKEPYPELEALDTVPKVSVINSTSLYCIGQK